MTNQIGTKFVELLPKITDFTSMKDPVYTETALQNFKTYEYNLNHITLSKFDDSQQNNNNYIIHYIILFLQQIFHRVSNINYPGETMTIPRQNHGTLNNLRCFKFGLWFIKTIYNSLTKDQIQELFPDNKFLVMILLSTIFEAIMRIDERSSFDILTQLNEAYFNKLYPNLSYDEFGSVQMTPPQIASSIFYKIIMTECFDCHPKQIEELALAVTFYWDDSINKTQHVIKEVNGRKRKVYTGPKGGKYIMNKIIKYIFKKDSGRLLVSNAIKNPITIYSFIDLTVINSSIVRMSIK